MFAVRAGSFLSWYALCIDTYQATPPRAALAPTQFQEETAQATSTYPNVLS